MKLHLLPLTFLLVFIFAHPVKSQVLDGGFTSIDVSSLTGGYERNPAGTPWTFSTNGASGISANYQDFDVEGAPSGQAGFIEGVGLISQTVSLSGGFYSVTFDAEGRGGLFGLSSSILPNELTVSLGGTQLFDGTPAEFTFQTFTTGISGFLAPGNYNLVFNGITPNSPNDYTSFIDEVAINPVAAPEPGSMAFLALALIAFFAVRRLYRQRASN